MFLAEHIWLWFCLVHRSKHSETRILSCSHWCHCLTHSPLAMLGGHLQMALVYAKTSCISKPNCIWSCRAALPRHGTSLKSSVQGHSPRIAIDNEGRSWWVNSPAMSCLRGNSEVRCVFCKVTHRNPAASCLVDHGGNLLTANPSLLLSLSCLCWLASSRVSAWKCFAWSVSEGAPTKMISNLL